MAKRKFQLEQADVNVVPLMDILTTMLFFLILMASFTNFTTLNALSELLSSSSNAEKKQVFDLVVVVKGDKTVEIHLGAFNEIQKVMFKDDLINYLQINKFTGSINKGFKNSYQDKNFSQLTHKIHSDLIKIKKSFPHEMKLTLSLDDKVSFESVVAFMSILTSLPQGSEAFELENFLGKNEKTRILFPEIALQEWGGNS